MADRRSGSTLLENILSKSAEAVSVGELAMLEGHILKEGPGDKWNWNCSCGHSIIECVFWSPILKEVNFEKAKDFKTNIDWNFKSKKIQSASLIPSVFNNNLKQLAFSKKNKVIVETLNNIYKSIYKITGKKIIIDSSKDPVQALALYKNKSDADIKIIWLKRDIRAIANSKNKWKNLNKRRQKSLLNILIDVTYYRSICYAVSKQISSADIVTINYEDLAINTQSELDRINKKFNLKNYIAPQFMELEEDHTIGGTPERFSKKPISYDGSWKKNYENKKLLYLMGGLLTKLR